MLDLEQTKEDLRTLLTKRWPQRIEDCGPDYREASVLLPLFIKDSEYWVLFMRRTDTVEYHKGEVSFPGGVVDEDDKSLEHTAKREAFEEIGMKSEDIEILGQLDDMMTMTSQFIIHPFVGLIPYPYEFTLSQREVEHLIEVPVRFFFDSSQPQQHPIDNYEGISETPAFVYEDVVIWGATERILENFVDLTRNRVRFP